MYKKLYKPYRFKNFKEIVYRSAERFAKSTAFQIRDGKGYKFITYEQVKKDFQALALYMLDMGLAGKRIAVTGKNSYRWVLHYLSAATIGVVVPIDKELAADDVLNFVESADCAAVFGDEKTVKELNGRCREGVILEGLEHTVSESLRSVSELDAFPESDEEMSVLIFTSGTTGNSKGVCLSQRNICTNIFQTLQMVKASNRDKTLSILPIHHTYECTLDCLLMLSVGACITYADSLGKIKANLQEYSPTILVVVPQLLRVLDRRLTESIKKGCPPKYKKAFDEGGLHIAFPKLPSILRAVKKAKVKKELGGKLRLCIVGAADLAPEIVLDFMALGIRTLQGYGLTECSPLLAGNSDFYFNPRSTGIAIPGVELKIDNPNENGVGEILAKGENIMLGYFEDEEATKSVFKDGYFCTGDLGRMDDDGALYIMGRMKNVIVTANGKNIYPEEIETRLMEDEGIKESLVLAAKDNSGDICVKAKIVPNIDFIKEKLGHLPSFEEIDGYIKETVALQNSKLPAYKKIKIFEVLENSLEKTTTQKIKRFGANLT